MVVCCIIKLIGAPPSRHVWNTIARAEISVAAKALRMASWPLWTVTPTKSRYRERRRRKTQDRAGSKLIRQRSASVSGAMNCVIGWHASTGALNSASHKRTMYQCSLLIFAATDPVIASLTQQPITAETHNNIQHWIGDMERRGESNNTRAVWDEGRKLARKRDWLC